jgi:hypothetical protein
LRDCLEYLGQRPWLSFLLIFSLAAAIRFALLTFAPVDVLTGRGEAQNIGVTLATQGRFADPFDIPTGPSAHNPPFFPTLVALLYRALGMGIACGWVRLCLGIVAYSALYGLLPRIAALSGLSGGAGVVGGFALAALPLRKSADVWSIWEDPYAAIALAFLLAWTVHLKRQNTPSWPQAVLYGVSWGALFHICPSLLVTYLGLAVYLVAASHHRLRIVRWVALAVIWSALVVTPWTLRNRRELGGWMFMRSNLGLELSYANNDEAQPTIILNRRTHRVNLHPDSSRQEAQRVARLGELAYNREKLTEAKAWIVTHPRRFAVLCAMRAAQMWFGAFEEPRWLSLPISAFTILGLLGLIALWRAAEFDPLAVIAVLWLTYPSVYFVFQYVNRYRGVFDWSIALVMGVFLISVLDWAAGRDPGLDQSHCAHGEHNR